MWNQPNVVYQRPPRPMNDRVLIIGAFMTLLGCVLIFSFFGINWLSPSQSMDQFRQGGLFTRDGDLTPWEIWSGHNNTYDEDFSLNLKEPRNSDGFDTSRLLDRFFILIPLTGLALAIGGLLYLFTRVPRVPLLAVLTMSALALLAFVLLWKPISGAYPDWDREERFYMEAYIDQSDNTGEFVLLAWGGAILTSFALVLEIAARRPYDPAAGVYQPAGYYDPQYYAPPPAEQPPQA